MHFLDLWVFVLDHCGVLEQNDNDQGGWLKFWRGPWFREMWDVSEFRYRLSLNTKMS